MIFDPPARESLDHWLSAAVLLDGEGSIIYANAAWRRFMNDNGGSDLACGPGTNYLKVCMSADGEDRGIARSVAEGIQEVMAGRRHWYEADYPCHSPAERRWFRVRVEPFLDDAGSRILVLHSPVASAFLEHEPFGMRSSRLETLLEALPVAAVVVSLVSRQVLFANSAFATIAGVEKPYSLENGDWGLLSSAPLPEGGTGEFLDAISSRSGLPVPVVGRAAALYFRSQSAMLLCFHRIPPGTIA